ncbi:Uncharacterized protein TCM_000916 [Theobroma cacao]|uniref:Uncharacterized protein n=1 Tax=Theobroma cacao TaxID=3641 RepID=A0A061DPG7_THECC|nr:Uncharacterized protein TCM_000916 [Theobroma cacao]
MLRHLSEFDNKKDEKQVGGLILTPLERQQLLRCIRNLSFSCSLLGGTHRTLLHLVEDKLFLWLYEVNNQ